MSDAPRFVLVTGLSGAGKGQALRFLEDLGYYCVDNLPAPLVPTFAELIVNSRTRRRRIAVCVDARAGEELRNLPAYLDEVVEMGLRPEALYLESSDRVLVNRYSETRRRHPLAPTGNIEEGIHRERELLAAIRARADLIIDTSATSTAELREKIASYFQTSPTDKRLAITVQSFGFKFGVPQEADLVFDVRFLPNPYYDEELSPLTGSDAPVREYVLNNDTGREFLDRLKGLLKFLIPKYAAEPKSYLTVAVGCTGGQHRSVAVAHETAMFLRAMNLNVRLRHRDVARKAGGA